MNDMWEALHKCDLLVVQSMPPNSQPGFYLCTKHFVSFVGAAIIIGIVGVVAIFMTWQICKAQARRT